MKVDRNQLLEDGFLIIRQAVPPAELDALKASNETLIERQGGRTWLAKGAQPRLTVAPLVDRSTANAVEIWLHENTLGVSRQLLCCPDAAAVTSMWVMCSPLTDHGPAHWHRDIHPIDMAPMRYLQLDMLENGPRYVQWNIALHDDDVLWVVPGSHKRLNTDAENRQIVANNRVPVDLKAGDGVVYVNFLLHWGSNYSTKLRRTLHGGYCMFTDDADRGCVQHLSAHAQQTFNRWHARSALTKDVMEATFRAALDRHPAAYRDGLETLQPGAGDAGKLVLTIYLCKAVLLMRIVLHPDLPDVPSDLQRWAQRTHTISLSWGAPFAQRFSTLEVDELWRRFEPLDAALRADEEQFMPGYQSGPMDYYFEQSPQPLTVEKLVAGWSD